MRLNIHGNKNSEDAFYGGGLSLAVRIQESRFSRPNDEDGQSD